MIYAALKTALCDMMRRYALRLSGKRTVSYTHMRRYALRLSGKRTVSYTHTLIRASTAFSVFLRLKYQKLKPKASKLFGKTS